MTDDFAASEIERLEARIKELELKLKFANIGRVAAEKKLRYHINKLAKEKAAPWRAFAKGVEKENTKLRRQLAHAIKELARPKNQRQFLSREEWLILLGEL